MLRLNSWLVSPYSAKVRAYLVWKGAEFVDDRPSVFALQGRIKDAVGRAVMPTVELPDGTWLQDSSEIIDTLEGQLPGPSITPPGPRQKVVDLLLELHGDEWLPMAALHYRWNRPKNKAFAMNEFARNGVPWLPAFLGRALVKPVAKRMSGYLPILGVNEQTQPGLEAYTVELIARLEAHFAAHRYLLGTRPCIGDFALFGPLWAHLYRDSASTELFDDAPAVRQWMERLLAPRTEDGDFLADDAVPATLEPVLATMLAEHGKYVTALIEAIDAWCDANPGAERVPRSLGPTAFTVGGVRGERRLLSEQLWMAQRPLDVMTPEALEWLRTLGPLGWEPRNRVTRRNFKVVLER